MLLRIISLSCVVFFLIVCFCGSSKNIEDVNRLMAQAKVQQAQVLKNGEPDGSSSPARQKNDSIGSVIKDTIGGGLVNAPNEVWTANLSGSAALNFVAITFLPDNSFIYRDVCKEKCREVEGAKEWEKIAGTIGKWHTEGNKITMIFNDGYTVTALYTIINGELKFDFEHSYDERLGSGDGIEGTYRKD